MENYQIFISYRRDGGDFLAGRIADRLSAMGYCVFFDMESMRSGTFNTQIYRAIDKCEVVILVLPPNALDRCKNCDDWVRQEITYALSTNKNIIPVIMRGFEFPDNLPEEISQIRFMEGLTASNDYFDAVVNRLTSLLKSKTKSKKIIDEVLYLIKQYNWVHSVQTTESGSIFINCSIEQSTPNARYFIFITADGYITIHAIKIIECTNCDLVKVYDLLHDINRRSLYVIFSLNERNEKKYIDAQYSVHPGISNAAGFSLTMMDEMKKIIQHFYPEMVKVMNQG